MNEMVEKAMRSARRGATHTVGAPAGPLGLKFATKRIANVGVMVESVAANSPIADLVGVGWLLVEVGKTTIDSGDAEGADALLQKYEASAVRTLKLLNPKAENELLDSIYTAYRATERLHVTVDAPPGKLGIWFGNAKDHRAVLVDGLASSSPLLGKVGVRWALLSIDGTDVSQLPHDAVTKMLRDGADLPRRRLKLDADPQKPPPRYLLVLLLIGLMLSVSMIFSSDSPLLRVPDRLSK